MDRSMSFPTFEEMADICGMKDTGILPTTRNHAPIYSPRNESHTEADATIHTPTHRATTLAERQAEAAAIREAETAAEQRINAWLKRRYDN